jgi:hypothetical protein
MSAETNNVVIDELGNVLPINENGEVEGYHFLDGTIGVINKYGFARKYGKVEDTRYVKYSREAQREIFVSKFGANDELQNNVCYRVTDIMFAPAHKKEDGKWYEGKPAFAIELEGRVRKTVASFTTAGIVVPGDPEVRQHIGSFMDSLNEVEQMFHSKEGPAEPKLDEVWNKLSSEHPSMLFRCRVAWINAMTKTGMGSKPQYTLEWVDDGSIAERNEPLAPIAQEAKPKRGRNNNH